MIGAAGLCAFIPLVVSGAEAVDPSVEVRVFV